MSLRSLGLAGSFDPVVYFDVLQSSHLICLGRLIVLLISSLFAQEETLLACVQTSPISFVALDFSRGKGGLYTG